jgi:hypothetical protein
VSFSPPAINVPVAVLLVGGTIVAIYAAGFAVRRRSDEDD